MQMLEGVLVALEALWANKLRTILTLLGNIVGVMSVIAVVSIIDGANSYIENQVAGKGSGVFSLQQVNSLDILSDFDKFLKSLHNPQITLSDLAYLREHVTLAEYMDATLGTSAEVRNRALNVKSVPVQGRSENYPLLGQWNLKDGRHFSSQDVQHSKDVVVIGFDVADRLYAGVDPIGKEIRIAGLPYRIIGVLAQQPSGLGGSPNLRIVIPITSFQKAFGAHRSLTIAIKPASLDRVAACVDQTRLAMRALRRLGPKREDNFAIITQDNLLKLWSSISSRIFQVLIGVVSISLIVGGIVIMNIMLVSVTERTREIGIRKAVGATRMNILWQFLVEAVTLSSVGGVLGIAAGFVIAATIALLSPLPYAIKLWSIAIGMGVTFAVGVFFGAYPAMQAARLDPIEALRYE
jgi:putative ABC transport system permease protein